MSTEQTQKVAELIKGERFAFLTTTSPDGTLTSRPMTLQAVEFDGDLCSSPSGTATRSGTS